MANKKGVIGTITEGFAESTRNVSAINKEHMAGIKADSRAVWDAARKPAPGMVEFKEAKGLGNKVKVIAENIRESAAEASEIERERRTDIQNHEAYRAIMQGQIIVPQIAGQYTSYNPLSRVVASR